MIEIRRFDPNPFYQPLPETHLRIQWDQYLTHHNVPVQYTILN